MKYDCALSYFDITGDWFGRGCHAGWEIVRRWL